MNRPLTLASIALVAVGCVASSLAADTWLWIGGSSNTYGGGEVGPGKGSSRDWRDGYNWTNLTTNVRGTLYPDNALCPQDGDFIVFDGAVTNDYTHCYGPASGGFGGILFTNYCGSSYGSHVPIKDGGYVRYEYSQTSMGNQSFSCSGTMEFFVRSGRTAESHFNKTGTLVKTGAGTFCVNRASGSGIDYIKLREGTVTLMRTNTLFYLKKAFVFDGPNVTLDLGPSYTLLAAGSALCETANATRHAISATGAGVALLLHGNQTNTVFSGKLTGTAGLSWCPADATKKLTLTGTASDTSGTLTTTNGVLELAAGVALPNAGIALSGDDAKLSLVSGPYAFGSGKVLMNGAAVADGVYAAAAARGVTVVPWITGGGHLFVGMTIPPEGTRVNAVWNGTGTLTTLANWNGAAELPPLDTGATYMQVQGGASATVDTDAWLKGIAFAVKPFAFVGDGAHDLWLGSLGLATPGNGGTYTLGAPVSLAAAQAWTVGAGDTLKITQALGTAAPGLLAVTNAGTISLEAGAPDFVNDVRVDGGTVDLMVDDSLGGATGLSTFSNVTLRLYGTTQHRPVYHYRNLTEIAGKTNVFLGKVTLGRQGGYTVGGAAGSKLVFGGGLEMNAVNGTTYTFNGLVVITNKPVEVGNDHRLNITGQLHLWASNNVINTAQQGWVQNAGATLYTHVPYAINGANFGLAPNQPGNCTWDLCGCDQKVTNGQFGRGSNGNAPTATKWKDSTQPGTVRSDLPAILHDVDDGFSARPSGNNSPSSTNWAYFVGMAGFSKDGNYAGHWLNQECSSSGTVQVTKQKLYFSKRFVDGQNYDYGEGRWPNASQAVAKGSGTLVFEHSKAIGKKTDVVIDGSGKVQLDAGVSQVCQNLYFGSARQALGTWGSSASAAEHKDDTRFAGTGVLRVRGEHPGVVIFFR